MKKLLLAVVGILFAATSFAQNGLVASLSHEGTVTYYYGVTALQQAVTAAQSGDIVNLSSGSFNATTINKAITLRGAGIDSEAPTYITGDFSINIPTEDAYRFMMEGIRCSNTMKTTVQYANPYFVRCQFNSVTTNNLEDAISNIMFANCKITGNFSVGGSCTFNFVNCFINNFAQYDAATITASNCIFEGEYYYGSNYLRQCQFSNCIFFIIRAEKPIPNNSQATNCISVNAGDHDFFSQLNVRPGCPTSSLNYETVFKTFTGTYSDEETFELTETFSNTEFYTGSGVKGSDIGIYGGLLPYNSTPSYPLINSMTVPATTNNQGKMDVTVSVSNPTE